MRKRLNKRLTIKYPLAIQYMLHWVGLYPDLTTVEFLRMIEKTELSPDEIPSRTRVQQLITDIKHNEITSIANMSTREKITRTRAIRKILLDVLAEKPFDDFVKKAD